MRDDSWLVTSLLYAAWAQSSPTPAPAPPPTSRVVDGTTVYRLAEDPFCAGLASALEARPSQWVSLRAPLPNQGDHARSLLPDAEDCSRWGSRDLIRYGCTMKSTRRGDPATLVVNSFITLMLHLDGCLGTAGAQQPATPQLRSYTWPGVELMLFLSGDDMWTQVNLTTPNPDGTVF